MMILLRAFLGTSNICVWKCRLSDITPDDSECLMDYVPSLFPTSLSSSSVAGTTSQVVGTSVPRALPKLPPPSTQRSMELQTAQSFKKAVTPSSPTVELALEPAQAAKSSGKGTGKGKGKGSMLVGKDIGMEKPVDGVDVGSGSETEEDMGVEEEKKKRGRKLNKSSSKSLVLMDPGHFVDLKLRIHAAGDSAAITKEKTVHNIGRLAAAIWELKDDHKSFVTTQSKALSVVSTAVQDLSEISHPAGVTPPVAQIPLEIFARLDGLEILADTLASRTDTLQSRVTECSVVSNDMAKGYNSTYDWMVDTNKFLAAQDAAINSMKEEGRQMRLRLTGLEGQLRQMTSGGGAVAGRGVAGPTPPGSSFASVAPSQPQRVFAPLPRQGPSHLTTSSSPSSPSSAPASTSSRPPGAPPAAISSTGSGLARRAPDSGMGAKRARGNDGQSYNRSLGGSSAPQPPVSLLMTFPAVQVDALASARALMRRLLPGTDTESIVGFGLTDSATTYTLHFKNTASGSGLNVANRFVEAFKKGGQDARLRQVTVAFPTDESGDIFDAMVNGLPLY